MGLRVAGVMTWLPGAEVDVDVDIVNIVVD